MNVRVSRIDRLGELGDVQSADRDRQALRPQASAPARAARDLAHELLEPLALALGVGLDVASLDDRDDALVRRPVRARPSVPVLVPDVDLGVRAVEHDVPRRLREPLPRRRGREPVRLRHRVEDAVPVLEPPARPRRERALGDRQVRVGHDELGVDLEPRPEPVAGLARAVRRVEREVPRLQLVEREAVERARERLAVRLHVLAVVGLDRDRGEALGQLERGLDRVGHPASDVGLGDEPVDHDLDRVLVVLREPDRLGRGRGPRRRSAPGRTPSARAPAAASRTRPCGPGRPARGPGTASPPGAARTWSTICSGVCRPIGRPHFGQCGWPIRAYSTRR